MHKKLQTVAATREKEHHRMLSSNDSKDTLPYSESLVVKDNEFIKDRVELERNEGSTISIMVEEANKSPCMSLCPTQMIGKNDQVGKRPAPTVEDVVNKKLKRDVDKPLISAECDVDFIAADGKHDENQLKSFSISSPNTDGSVKISSSLPTQEDQTCSSSNCSNVVSSSTGDVEMSNESSSCVCSDSESKDVNRTCETIEHCVTQNVPLSNTCGETCKEHDLISEHQNLASANVQTINAENNFSEVNTTDISSITKVSSSEIELLQEDSNKCSSSKENVDNIENNELDIEISNNRTENASQAEQNSMSKVVLPSSCPDANSSPRRSMRRKLIAEKKELQKLEEQKRNSDDQAKITGPKPQRRDSQKKRKVTYRPQKPAQASEVEKLLEGVEGEIDRVLEDTAQKNRLTTANVKNILRHVITNEYVLAMVRNTMKSEAGDCDDAEEAFYEPKLTRSKAKELREKKADLPWPVATLEIPKPTSSIKLLEEEFSEEEGSSDEEYNPAEEECPSEDDDESLVSSQVSEIGSPPPVSTTVQPTGCTTSDQDEDNSGSLAIALPESPLHSDPQVDEIASRTRSKLPLNDTPLESIEAAFIAPDITIDMYDTECDDEEWKNFLNDFMKPLELTDINNGVDDDGEDDPEYNFLEEEDVLDQWDLRNDRAVKISKRELNELMAELLEAAEQELNDADEDDDVGNKDYTSSESCTTTSTPSIPSPMTGVGETHCMIETVIPFPSEERSRLDEQMRMHVQLLSQMYLLTHEDPHFRYYKESSHLLLMELKRFANRELLPGHKSAFCAHNLNEAVDMISKLHVMSLNDMVKFVKSSLKKERVTPLAASLMAQSPVFIYSSCLPICGYRTPQPERNKVIFTLAEDHLIALGLEQFIPLSNDLKYISLIHNHMLPTKTERQIRFRIKNVKSSKFSDANPIKYYFKFKKAPPVNRSVKYFDPNNVCLPVKQPMELLPKWMKFFVESRRVSLAPAAAVPRPRPPPPTISSSPGPVCKTPQKRKYNPILPRPTSLGSPSYRSPQKLISPLKHISPILKKYGHCRRLLPRMPLHSPLTPVKKPSGGDKKQCRRVLSGITNILETSDKCSDQVTELTAGSADNSHENHQNKSQQVNDNEVTVQQEISTVSMEIVASSETEGNVQLAESQSTILEDSPDVEESHHPDNDGANESQNEMDTCEEGDGEGEDEALDDEQDLAALMAASSTICKKQQQPLIKKKNRQQRELESTLLLLAPDLIEMDPRKEEREVMFAQSYLLRVKEAVKDEPGVYEAFLQILCEFESSSKSAIQLYEDINTILDSHPALVDDFVGFLLPEQAKDCGKLAEYLTLSKIRAFLRKLEVHFSNQPQHIQRILRTLSQIQRQLDISSSGLGAALQPLLRSQSHLLEEFLQLLPNEPPPESLMTDFEEITIPETDAENTSEDSVEELVVPETEDKYGSKQCPCVCHMNTPDLRMQNRCRHCVKCGTKFLDGKIYIQTGKVLKPAQVIYHTISDAPQPLDASTQLPNNHDRSPSSLQGSDSPLSSLSPSPAHLSSQEEEPQDDQDQDVNKPVVPLSDVHSPLTPDTPEAVKAHNATHAPVLPSEALDTSPDSKSPPRNMESVFIKTAQDICRSNHPLLGVLEELSQDTSPSNLHVPTVIENAILPPDTSDQSSCLPADFSGLRDAIKHNSLSCKPQEQTDVQKSECDSSGSRCKDPSENTASTDCKMSSLVHNLQKSEELKVIQPPSVDCIMKCDSQKLYTSCPPSDSCEENKKFCLNMKNEFIDNGIGFMLKRCDALSRLTQHFSGDQFTEIKWTRKEDRILLQTCQKLGATEKAFVQVTKEIESKSVEQVRERFHELMDLFSHQKSDEETDGEGSE